MQSVENHKLISRLMWTLVLFIGSLNLFVNGQHDFQFDNGNDDDLQVMFTEPVEEAETLEPSKKTLYEKEVSECPYSENKVILSLVLRSQNWDNVVDNKRVKALNKLSKFFMVPKEFFNLDDISRLDIYEMMKYSLKRGPNHLTGNNKKLGRLEFMVGCGSQLFPTGKLIAHQISEQMKDGTIDEISGLDFDWWSIWTKRVNNRVVRTKRETDGSGEEDYDYYEEEEEGDDDDEEITENPPISTHAHRHHHGDNKQNTDRDKTIKLSESVESSPNIDITNELDIKVELVSDAQKSSSSSSSSTPPPPPSSSLSSISSENIDPEMRESVSKLESDITKTIENNNSKLKEVEEEIKKIQIEKYNHNKNDDAFVGEKDKLSVEKVIEDDVITPIIETISEDVEIQIVKKQPLPSLKNVEDDYVIEDVSHIKKDDKSKYDKEFSYETTTSNVLMTNTNVPNIIRTTLSSTTVGGAVNDDKNGGIVPETEMKTMKSVEIKPVTEDIETTTFVTTSISKDEDELTDEDDEDLDNESSIDKKPIQTQNIFESATIATTQTPTTTPLTFVQTTTPTAEIVTESEENIKYRVGPRISLENVPVTTTENTIITTTLTTTTTTTEEAPVTQSTPRIVTTTDITDDIPDEYEDTDEESGVDDNHERTTIYDVPTTTEILKIPRISSVLTTTTTERITTTTEYIEPEPINNPPMIKNRLPKQPLTAGKPFSLHVPLETFYDNEDGTNLQLSLYDKNDHPLKTNSWIQFNPETREIYGLPLEDAVSRWQYKLHATDSVGQTVIETLDISVQQHKSHRSANHEISIGVKLNEKFRNNVDWQIRLIRGIIETLGDSSMSSIVVREIHPSLQDPNAATFVYTNETLPKDKCPEEELDNLLKRLNIKELSNSLAPEITVKSVTGQQIGPCQKQSIVKVKPTPSIARNFPPVPRNQVDRVNATVGQLLIFQVPLDTFYDLEDGVDLKMSLLTLDSTKLDAKHWLQFDSKNQEFYGIPKTGDAGQKEYLLVAEDHNGQTATDALVVVVNPAVKRDYSALFEMKLGIPYESFNNSAVQRRFIERVAQVFGDPTTSNIQIRSIRAVHISGQTGQNGHTLVSFYNTTLYKMNERCPHEEIKTLKNILIHQNAGLRDRVRETIGSEFNLLTVNLIPAGTCQGTDTIHHVTHVPVKTEDKPASSFKDDYLLTFVLPAVIILAMLLLASIIACVLHRRRLTGKMELGDEEERRSFRSKGIPVIFQDELDEKPEIGNKSPVILKDEKPPLLPPSYNSTNPDGDNEDVDEYVPPPAVIIGGRENRGKSPVTPSYRKPPPYVSP